MPVPRSFGPIKNAILGKDYELSVAFVSAPESQRLNKRYRGKNKPANVLSFPLDSNSGEIILCKTVAAADAPKFGYKPRQLSHYLHFLFIHGLLHLKGFDHGSTMESKERYYCAKFKITAPFQQPRGTNNNNRH